MGVLDAVEAVLAEAGTPLRAGDITHRVLDSGRWRTQGKTPSDTIRAEMAMDIKERGLASRFQRASRGQYALRVWGLPEYTAENEEHHDTSTATTTERGEQPDEHFPTPVVHANVSVSAAPVAPAAASAPPSLLALLPVRGLGRVPTPARTPATTLSFTDAAEHVLDRFGGRRPMHYRDITNKALELGLLKTSGRTPEASLYAQVLTEMARQTQRGETPRFAKLGRGLIALSRWQGRGLAGQIEQHNAEVRKKLHARLRAMPPDDFETLIGQLLAAMGFADVEVTSRSGDGGIDVRGTLVVGDVIRTRMAVQVKRWKHNVQSPVVQQVRGSLGAHEQGLIITSSDFSAGARQEASRADATPVGLMDGGQLVALLVEHDIGVRRTSHHLLELGDIEQE